MSERVDHILKRGDLSASYTYRGHLRLGDDRRTPDVSVQIATRAGRTATQITLSINGVKSGEEIGAGIRFVNVGEWREFVEIVERHIAVEEREKQESARHVAAVEEYYERSCEIDSAISDPAERRRLKQELRDDLSLS
jgi:hypothetical protein